jgi:transcriptional regulator with XRE-family HTH domain
MRDLEPPEGSVGERLRGLLDERKMSQRQLAAALAENDGGVSAKNVENLRRQVSSWVNDEHVPSAENAAKIGRVLDVPAELFSESLPARKSLPAALAELGHVVGLLTEHVEKEAARSEDAVRIVQGLDQRLERNEELIRQLLEGQLAAAGALEALLERRDEPAEGHGGHRSRGSSS